MAVTWAQASANYLDNAGYSQSGSLSEARAFEVAARQLIHLQPQRAMHGAIADTQFDVRLLKEALDDVRAWISSSAGGGIKHVSFEELRT